MNDLIPLAKCSVTITGASFDESITWEQWLDVMRKAVRVKEAIQWVIGDGINFAFRKFVDGSKTRGDRMVYLNRYTEALKSLPYEPHSLNQFASVARRVESYIRMQELSFGHHALVAPFDQKKQKRYLAVANQNKFSVADLNAYIRDNEKEDGSDSSGPASAPGPLEWASKLSTWCRQQEIAGWTRERRETVKRDLRPIAELYQRL